MRRKRMNVGELGPGDWNHFTGCVELHGATAQRNHAAVQRQVFVAKPADVTQHAGFAVVGVEHRMRQKVAGALQFGRNQGSDALLKIADYRHRLARLGKK